MADGEEEAREERPPAELDPEVAAPWRPAVVQGAHQIAAMEDLLREGDSEEAHGQLIEEAKAVVGGSPRRQAQRFRGCRGLKPGSRGSAASPLLMLI